MCDDDNRSSINNDDNARSGNTGDNSKIEVIKNEIGAGKHKSRQTNAIP